MERIRKSNLDNYRGISISNSLQKLYSRILERRLRRLVEQEGWLSEIQGGFRDNRSTMDQLFILTSIAEWAKASKKKTFFAFIDLRKAFDSIPRSKLWSSLDRFGLGGKFSRLMQILYSGHKCKVDTLRGWTDWIPSEKGVKQGCVLSPLLFNLYLVSIEHALLKCGVGITVGDSCIPALFFADDMVIMAESKKDLNTLLSTLLSALTAVGLNINFSKSEILIIGKKSIEEELGTWAIPDAHGKPLGRLKILDNYRYLGVNIGSKRIFSSHLQNTASSLNHKVSLGKILAGDVTNKITASDLLWRGKMLPAILYGAELLLFTKKWIDKAEKAQNGLGRYLLKVNRRTVSSAIRAELGWSSIKDLAYLHKIRFWEHLKSLPKSRWVKQALFMITDGSYTSNWYQEILRIRRNLSLIAVDVPVDSHNHLSHAHYEGRLRAWTENKRVHPSLSFCPKANPIHLARYLDGSQASLILAKFRIENWTDFDNNHCPVCGTNFSSLKAHILLTCKNIPSSGNLLKVRRRAAEGLSHSYSPERVLLEFFYDPSFNLSIASILRAWIKRGGKCSY